jgi:hypothetical protein
MARLRSEQGLSLIEVAIMLIATVMLVGVLAPSLAAVVRNAENTAATTAMTVIRDAVLEMVSTDGLRITTTGSQAGSAPKVELIVSDGDTPREISATGSARWQGPVDVVAGLTDFIESHLVLNDPISSPLSYGTGGGNAWRGAYITAPVDPDPWGNRYGVNAQYLGGGAGGQNDVVVWSAGRDEEVDTAFTANPLAAGDDDLILLVES